MNYKKIRLIYVLLILIPINVTLGVHVFASEKNITTYIGDNVGENTVAHELTLTDLRKYWQINESNPNYIAVYRIKDENITGYEKIVIPGEIEGKQIQISTAVFPRNLQEITFKVVNGKKVLAYYGSTLFSGYTSLHSIDFSGLDTSQINDMTYMFNGCTSLANIDLTSFNTSQVTSMNGMFNNCSGLTNVIGLDGLDLSRVKDMSYMFNGCTSLANIDLTSFDTNQVTNMNSMFRNCNSLNVLDLSSFNTNKVVDMKHMFYVGVQTPLLLITNDSKLTTYNFANDNRTRCTQTYNAGDGTFANNMKELKKELFSYTFASLEEADVAVRKLEAESVEIPTRPGYIFVNWEKTTGVVNSTKIVNLEDINARVNVTYIARWKADTTALAQKVEEAKAKVATDTLIPNSVTEINTVIKEATELMNSGIASPMQVQAMMFKIDNALMNAKEKANKAELEALVNNPVNTNGMTAESIQRYEEVLSQAREVLANPNALQSDVQNMINQIQEVTKALEKEQTSQTPITGDMMTLTAIAMMLASAIAMLVLRRKEELK